MIRRPVLIAAAVLAFVAVGAGAPRTQLPGQPLFLAGRARMSTSPNGLATVVTITTRQWSADGFDAVEWAFRLQHAKPNYLAFEGRAEVVYEARRLTVVSGTGEEWQFLVADRLPDDLLEPSEVQRFAVVGLSRHWGIALQLDKDAVFSALLARACSVADGGGDCTACQLGGADAPACSAMCGGTEMCSVECISGYHACCNCPNSCLCCPDQIMTSARPVPR
jgi:hypothetical protein